jgi:uncharacterized protein (DUF2062 family)
MFNLLSSVKTWPEVVESLIIGAVILGVIYLLYKSFQID